ncbi:MAG: hypothetical protein ACR2HS_00990 [Gammaproteobacteria bacterium]|jgi:hypothetical protein
MKTFTAEIKTETGIYFIDLKSGDDYHQLKNKFAVMYSGGAIYLNTVQECIDWIEEHNQYLLNKAA